MTTLKKFWLCSNSRTFENKQKKKKSLNYSYTHLREISSTHYVPDPWDVGGCQGSTSSRGTCSHVGTQMIQNLGFREGKALAFVPFSSPISHLSTKLLWR